MRSVLEKQRLRVAAPLRRPSARAHLALQYVGVRVRLDVAAVAVSSARAKRRTVACGRVRCRSCLQLIAVHLPRVVLEKAAKQPAHASRLRAARNYVLLVR